jgi:hypothetical protein
MFCCWMNQRMMWISQHSKYLKKISWNFMEETLRAKRAALEDPAIASDGPRLLAALTDVEVAERALQTDPLPWTSLRARKSSSPVSLVLAVFR